MIHEIIPLREQGSTDSACIETYLIEDSDEYKIKKRPVIVVCPGGGYCYLSSREGEMLALQYLAMGYHAVVLKYSVAPAVYPTALTELARTVLMLRQNAEKWHVDTAHIIVEGSSAGGHLAASYGMFWSEAWVARQLALTEEMKELLRPNGMILNYPVITSGEFAHRDSFRNLLGAQYDALIAKMSLENQVNKDTPPAFIWHTYTDGCVPVENSFALVSALKKAGIPAEFHLYPEGGHGLGLASRITETPEACEVVPACQSWIGLVHTWLTGLCGY
ncbi:MAG: alpha/beta hydrolase [Lachnospiraceae bacterium]